MYWATLVYDKLSRKCRLTSNCNSLTGRDMLATAPFGIDETISFRDLPTDCVPGYLENLCNILVCVWPMVATFGRNTLYSFGLLSK